MNANGRSELELSIADCDDDYDKRNLNCVPFTAAVQVERDFYLYRMRSRGHW
jgi:hypothetical protein